MLLLLGYRSRSLSFPHRLDERDVRWGDLVDVARGSARSSGSARAIFRIRSVRGTE